MMKKIEKTVSLLSGNPRLLPKVLGAKFITPFRRPPGHSVQKEMNGVRFEFDFDYGPQMKTMYFDSFEPLTIEIMKRFLRKGDTFIDIGANIGFLSAIGAGLVGKAGQVHCFEPSPRDFKRLEGFARLNPDHKIVCNQCALGEEPGTANLDVTNLWWIGWNTIVPNFMRTDARKESVQVPVMRFDEYVREKGKEMGRISLVKIDTEGFELPVLKGFQRYFESTSLLPAILCEVNPQAFPLLGRTLTELSGYMKNYRYRPVTLWNTRKEVDISKLNELTDILFVPGKP